MKNKRGISLIVLVITIIIIIILAGAVILNLADNNPIENASEAQILSDLDTYIATKDYATHSDSDAAAKTVYNQVISAPEENEEEEIIYPLLARKGI